MRLYLIRHCTAAGQTPDAPLTAAGLRQAEELEERLAGAGIEAIVSSPFLRALQSMEPLSRRLGIPVQVDERLAERVLSSGSLPDWRDALRRTFLDPDLSYLGGESSRAATERGLAALREIADGGYAAVVVATHGNLLALLLRSFDATFGFDAWAALTNPDCYLVTRDAAGTAVRRAWP